MALGDGIRRNLSTVDPAERKMLRDAILELHKRYYPGATRFPVASAGGSSKTKSIRPPTFMADQNFCRGTGKS